MTFGPTTLEHVLCCQSIVYFDISLDSFVLLSDGTPIFQTFDGLETEGLPPGHHLTLELSWFKGKKHPHSQMPPLSFLRELELFGG